MPDLWELAARESIGETLARYSHLGDAGKIDDLVALFAPDGVLEVRDRGSYHGREGIRSFLAQTAEAFRGASLKFMRHYVSTVTIADVSRSEGRAAAYFHVLTDRGLDHWGRYRDVLVPGEERWLFAHRLAIIDDEALDGWSFSLRPLERRDFTDRK